MRVIKNIILISLISNICYCHAQSNLVKAKIYADFINQSVNIYDSTFNKKTELIFISGIKSFELNANLDLESLSDYLLGDTESNELFQLIKIKFGQSPESYFHQIPWGNFGKLLIQDSTFGHMILDLDSMLKSKYKLSKPDNIHTNYRLKFTNGKIPHGANAWNKFYIKNKNCFGILKLSNVYTTADGRYAAFYSESYHYPLFANGDLVFMELTESGWIILQYINLWVS